MSKSNVEIVRGAYEAFARGDVTGVLGALDPSVVWEPSEPAGGRFRGCDAVLGFFQGLGNFYSALQVRPEIFVAEGERVVVLGQHEGRAKETGTPISVPFAHAWRLKDGLATSFVEYTDTAVLVRAVSGAKALA